MTTVSSPSAFQTPATTPPASSSTANGSGGPGIITNQGSLDTTFSDFLTLLTTQLKHQDPTSPMDTAQFTSQLVSFSQVEQQLKSNADLDKLVTMANNNQTSLGLSYIGLNVDVQGNKFNFDPSKDASVTVGYNLASAATSDKINVLDGNGNTVYTTGGSLKSGPSTFSWNGNDQNGKPVPAGTYTVEVSASDSTNTPINVTTQVPGQVTGMQTASDGTVELMVGGQLVPLTSVTSAFLPVTASNSGSSATGG